MESIIACRTFVDIAETVMKQCTIVSHHLSANALSGCDTAERLDIYDTGKGTELKTLIAGRSLDKLGDIQAEVPSVITKASAYLLRKQERENISDVRVEVWSRKMGKAKLKSAPEFKILPPTTEAFQENVLRAHFQTAIWKSALDSSAPLLDATQFGWMRD
jgi:hypothetical protein